MTVEGMTMRIVIIGAGVAGLSCGRALAAYGWSVTLIDKGRGPAGRLASRRIDTPQGEAVLDMGTQSFTARGEDFAAEVSLWAAAGVVAPWAPAGPGHWVGAPAMNAVVRHLATDQPVRWSLRANGLIRADSGWLIRTEQGETLSADAVVVALPPEQAVDLLGAGAPAFAVRARDSLSAPCWTALLTFASRLPIEADVWRGAPGEPVALAVRNRAKPGRTGPESWVLHATPEWSADHLEAAPDDVGRRLLQALAGRADGPLPASLTVAAHRWRYAQSTARIGLLWDQANAIGVCGDWCGGSDVEGAWRSGVRLAATIVGDGGQAATVRQAKRIRT